MLRKIQTEYASMGETILDEDDNEDGIYLHREIYDDFMAGRSKAGVKDHPVFTNGLLTSILLYFNGFVVAIMQASDMTCGRDSYGGTK